MHRNTLVLVLACMLASFSIAAAVDAPQWIGAFPIQKKVGLKWQPAEGAEAYAIYRSVAGAPAEKLAEVSQAQYFDEAVEAGETYDYTIKAVAGGAEGPASEVKSVTMPGVKAGEMKGPEWIGVREERGRLYLRWLAQKGADVVAYNLQRSETPGGPYELVASIQETKYVDRTIEQGKTYYYVVSALDANFQESPKSAEQMFSYGAAPVEEADGPGHELTDISLNLLFALETADGTPLSKPADVVVTSDGRIYVADGGRVVVYDAEGTFVQTIGTSQASPTGGFVDGFMSGAFTLALDAQENLYVADIKTRDIQKFDSEGTFLRRYATSEIPGEKGFCPTGLAILPDGGMYVSDRDNDRILKLDAEGNVVWERGTQGEGDGQFVVPNEIGIDSKGDLYVVDVLNQRVQKFGPDGEFMAWFGGSGNVVGAFARPKGLFVDEKDQVWVADGMSNVVQIWTPEHRVIGAVGVFDDVKLQFSNPRGVAVHGNRIYIADRSHNRVMVFEQL